MKKLQKAILFSLLTAIVLLGTACQAKQDEPGKPANENLKVTTLNGTETYTWNIFSQAELTVVNVWNPSCTDCEDEMKTLGTLSRDYAGLGVQVIGIIKGVAETDDAASLAMVESAGADYTQLLDSPDVTDTFLDSSYEVPATLFINRKGALLGTSQGENKSIANWREEIESYHQQVCTNDHPAECATG